MSKKHSKQRNSRQKKCGIRRSQTQISGRYFAGTGCFLLIEQFRFKCRCQRSMRRGTFKLVRSVITPISYIYLHITFFLSVYTVQSTIIKIKAQSQGQREYTYTNEYKLLMKTQSINQVRISLDTKLYVIKITYRFFLQLNNKSYSRDTFYSENIDEV